MTCVRSQHRTIRRSLKLSKALGWSPASPTASHAQHAVARGDFPLTGKLAFFDHVRSAMQGDARADMRRDRQQGSSVGNLRSTGGLDDHVLFAVDDLPSVVWLEQ